MNSIVEGIIDLLQDKSNFHRHTEVFTSFITISFLGVFETIKLIKFSIKACGTSMVD